MLFYKFFVTLGFSGFFPKIPGTVGSIVSIPLILLVFYVEDISQIKYLTYFIYGGLLFFSWICIDQYVIRVRTKDPQEVVMDEFLGLFIPFFVIPHTISFIVMAFCFFRFFDILKPFPISWIDKNIVGAWGIILDDILAGIFASGVVAGIYGIDIFYGGLWRDL